MPTRRPATPVPHAPSTLDDWREQLLAAGPIGPCVEGERPVLGVGAVPSRLALVGEAPGAQEERLGQPFVGPSGQLLDRLLDRAGLDRDRLWVTNAVKCRPKKLLAGRERNRPPTTAEIRAWEPWLLEELRLVGAEIVVCLGAVPTRVLIGDQARITALRGTWQTGPGGVRALATFHPSYLLRLQGPDREETIEQVAGDLTRVREALG